MYDSGISNIYLQQPVQAAHKNFESVALAAQVKDMNKLLSLEMQILCR
jgi:hypothetical protein